MNTNKSQVLIEAEKYSPAKQGERRIDPLKRLKYDLFKEIAYTDNELNRVKLETLRDLLVGKRAGYLKVVEMINTMGFVKDYSSKKK